MAPRRPASRHHFLGSIIAFLFLCLLHGTAFCGKSLYRRDVGAGELELEGDFYYTSLDWYIPLTDAPIPAFTDEDELKIYRRLLLSPAPRFLVAEASVNPLPCLGTLIRKNDPDGYRRASAGDDLNLVEALCAGFEEPYAVSLFFGDVVSFRPPGADDREGKGYVGFLLSGGTHHIRESELVDDRWWESEIKIKGDRLTPDRKMSWGCRVGVKFHGNGDVRDTVYFSLRRDRTDYGCTALAHLFHNSSISYTIDFDIRTARALRHHFLAGKKYPLGKTAVLGLSTGFVYVAADRYTGRLEHPDRTGTLQVLLQPDIEF